MYVQLGRRHRRLAAAVPWPPLNRRTQRRTHRSVLWSQVAGTHSRNEPVFVRLFCDVTICRSLCNSCSPPVLPVPLTDATPSVNWDLWCRSLMISPSVYYRLARRFLTFVTTHDAHGKTFVLGTNSTNELSTESSFVFLLIVFRVRFCVWGSSVQTKRPRLHSIIKLVSSGITRLEPIASCL